MTDQPGPEQPRSPWARPLGPQAGEVPLTPRPTPPAPSEPPAAAVPTPTPPAPAPAPPVQHPTPPPPAGQPAHPQHPAAGGLHPAPAPGRGAASAGGSAGGRIVSQLLAALAGLAATYLATAVLVLLAVLGTACGSHIGKTIGIVLAQLGAANALADPAAVVSTTVQVVALALGGTLHGSVSILTSGLAATLHLPVLTVTPLAILLPYGTARRLVRRPVEGPGDPVPAAAVSGFVVALLVVALTRFLPMARGGAALHATTPALFVTAFVVASACSWLGAVHGGGASVLGRHPLARETRRALGVLALHLACFSAVAVLGAGFALGKDMMSGVLAAVGDVLAAPLVAGNVLAWLFVLACGGRVATSLTGSAINTHASSWLFDHSFPIVAVALVAGVVSAMVAALHWARVRRVGEVTRRAEVASWLFLPATYLLAGLALLLDRTVSTARSDVVGAVSTHVGFGWWTPLLTALVGLVVDLLARFVAPALLPRLRHLASRVPGRHVAPNPSAPAAVLGAHAQAPTSPGPPSVSPVPRPLWRRWPVMVGAGLVSVLLVAMTAHLVGRSTSTSSTRTPTTPTPSADGGPEPAVRTVLDAIVAGDASKALSITGKPANPMLSTALYRATPGRPTGYRLTGVDRAGDSATVDATLVSGHDAQPVQLSATRTADGQWKVATLPTSTITMIVPRQATSLLVNGHAVWLTGGTPDAGGGTIVELEALPGHYAVTMASKQKYLTYNTADFAVQPRGAKPASAALWLVPNQAMGAEVDRQLRDRVASCVKKNVPKVTGCPFTAYVGGRIRNFRWKVKGTITATIDPGVQQKSWYFHTDPNRATATYSYEEDFGDGHWVPMTGTDAVSLSGMASTNGKVVTLTYD